MTHLLTPTPDQLSRVKRWLLANDITTEPDEIPLNSFHVDEDWIEYETVRLIGTGLHRMPHRVPHKVRFLDIPA